MSVVPLFSSIEIQAKPALLKSGMAVSLASTNETGRKITKCPFWVAASRSPWASLIPFPASVVTTRACAEMTPPSAGVLVGLHSAKPSGQLK